MRTATCHRHATSRCRPPFFDDEPTLLGEYLVDNYEAVAPAYADAGVSIVLTGHMHANDISAYTSAAGNTLHDVETDSLATYPSYIRTGTLLLE